MDTNFNKMQTLKRRFFAMRNGLLADQLRKAGSQFRIIFGLNVIQLKEIAGDYGHDTEFARELWNNVATRESMLLAPMLWQPDDFDFAEIIALCNEIPEVEVADMVCHRLLKQRNDAKEIIEKLIDSDESLLRYTALRLALPLIDVCISPEAAIAMADKEISRRDNMTLSLASMVKSEAEFLLEEE